MVNCAIKVHSCTVRSAPSTQQPTSNCSPRNLRCWAIPLTPWSRWQHTRFCLVPEIKYSSEVGKTLAPKATSITQPYVTTISLVLVTTFRAALGASIGLCYTQQMWKTFSNRLLTIEFIENLFQARANTLRLLSPSMLRYTPILFMLALPSWLLLVAMIYPPGALTVVLKAIHTQEVFNVSWIPPEGFPNLLGNINLNGMDHSGIGFANIRRTGSMTRCADDLSKCFFEYKYVRRRQFRDWNVN